ncbi:hypothetical protein BD414DRAFT_580899 [Trametes punicea]|nr:hypothetical protein BD414DRAFT_580899 [Trametes punicea]
MEVSPSSTSSIPPSQVRLSEFVNRMHANYISLPEELCAASRPSSPSSEARAAGWQTQIVHTLGQTGGDTTHPNWGYVSRIVRLACTSRRYVGVAPGVRVGDQRNVDIDKRFNWDMPDTDEEWLRYEKNWEEAVGAEMQMPTSTSKGKNARTSKYWRKSSDEQPGASSSRAASLPSKASLVREKVKRWQAEVVPEPDEPLMPQETTAVSQSPKAGKTKAKVALPSGEKVQASLGFPVVKRSSVTDAKGGHIAAPKVKGTPSAHSSTALGRDFRSDCNAEAPMTGGGQRPPGGSQGNQLPRITEVPEHSFLPPSFSSQLQTSTPPLNLKRRKPAPIAPCSPPPSSPLSIHSPHSFDPSRPQRRDPPLVSSSLSPASPAPRPLKRPLTPKHLAEGRMDVSQRSPTSKTPPTKKARTDPSLEQEPNSSGPQPVPPSTPPPTTSPVAAPVTPVSRRRGLGNAKGLPVPTTPDPHPLPSLTELLASSRRSRPRPRPPSRKHAHQSQTALRTRLPIDRQVEAESDLHAAGEDPEPSPTKTYFSSPASGSSDSASIMHRSPVSPLFTQNPAAFAPAFVSSQRPSANDDYPFVGSRSQTQSQGQGLMRGSSGFFAMGYNSQFDVEGQVDRVSELLERDIDYHGWLRDMDEVDEELPLTQSQDAVRVGF